MSKKPEIYDILIRSFGKIINFDTFFSKKSLIIFLILAPSIWEMENIKKGILCQLFGGSNQNNPKSGRFRFDFYFPFLFFSFLFFFNLKITFHFFFSFNTEVILIFYYVEIQVQVNLKCYNMFTKLLLEEFIHQEKDHLLLV